IKMDGNVQACALTDLILGNLFQNSFSEIWNSELFREFRRQNLSEKRHNFKETYCNFGSCIYIENNLKIQRIMKWF
ncbi:SPASM domain-containing protein, partial [candidate division CSSED10-310 bacterium]